MPNAKVLSEKQAIVAELTEKLKSASSGVLVDYKGITVAEWWITRASPWPRTPLCAPSAARTSWTTPW